MDYFSQVVVLIGIYSILAVSLDLLVGHMGVLSLAHAGFYGLGAYSAALMSVLLPGSFLAAAVVAVTVSAGVALLLVWPTLGQSGGRLVLAIFAVQVVLTSLMTNLTWLTRGPLGISITRSASSGGWIQPPALHLAMVVPCLLLTCFLSRALTSGSHGRALHAIRENELFTQTRGRNTKRYRWEVFCASAGLAGLAGAIYAHVFGFVDPTGFTFAESLLILSMVIVGGSGRLGGALLGAAILIILGEFLRFVGLPSGIAANIRQIIYGALLVAVLLFRPHGLVGRYGLGRS